MNRKESLGRLQNDLVAKRDALRRLMQTDLSLAQPEGAGRGDEVDMAHDGSQTELHSQLAALESRDLNQIERAISRIGDGRYGSCEGCDTRIPAARLKALPFTTHCIACQQKRERLGADLDESEDWESVYEYEGKNSDRQLTIGDIDLDLT